MSTEPKKMLTLSCAPAAVRMRRYRKRRRGGTRCARIQLDVTTIDTLIRKGHLAPEARDDQKALELAVSDFIWDAVTYGT